MITSIHDVEKVVSEFLRGRFNIEHVHVLQVEYDKDVWTAEGGFVAKDCPLAVFTVKVDREGNVLSQRVVCTISPPGKLAERTYG